MENESNKAKILAIIFVICSINLFVSIVLTITTSPGYIPEETEWDMPIEESEEESHG